MRLDYRKWYTSFSHRSKNIFFLVGIFTLLVLITEALHISESDTRDDTPLNRYFKVFPVPLPDSMAFAGESVPMNHLGVRESFEQEMLVNTYWQSQSLLMLKRAHRYFPLIESILKEDSVPDDFKYLALAESAFDYRASKAGAVGFWQLMKSTAKVYNLEINKDVDERYNLVESTEAACRYLKDAYNEFHNWTLAAASYNMGLGGVEKALREEKENNYYDLALNYETRRYVYRILALKQLVTHPTLYGYYLEKQDYYMPIPSYTVTVDSSISSLADFAEKRGISYHVLKILNPWLISSKLDNPQKRTYVITLPRANASFTELGETMVYGDSSSALPLTAASSVTAKDSLLPPPNVIEHTVKSGETIDSIAKQYNVPVERLRVWNSLSDTVNLKPGDEIMIFPKTE